MKPEELKKKTILVKYLFPDNLPHRGYKRMQYYTSFADAPEKYYLGLSIRTSYTREKLKDWVKKEQLVELKEPIILPYEKDLYLDSEGRVVIRSASNAKDGDVQVIDRPREFSKAKMLLKNIDDSKLKVTRRTQILAQ